MNPYSANKITMVASDCQGQNYAEWQVIGYARCFRNICFYCSGVGTTQSIASTGWHLPSKKSEPHAACLARLDRIDRMHPDRFAQLQQPCRQNHQHPEECR